MAESALAYREAMIVQRDSRWGSVMQPIEPLVPFFEANQGLLSFLALVAVFLLAVYEFRRAERASRDTKDDDVREVISAIDSVFTLARSVRANFIDPKYVPGLVRSFNRDVQQAARDLDLIAMKCSRIDMITSVTGAADVFRTTTCDAVSFEQLDADVLALEARLAAHRRLLLEHHLSPLRRRIFHEVSIENMKERPDDDTH